MNLPPPRSAKNLDDERDALAVEIFARMAAHAGLRADLDIDALSSAASYAFNAADAFIVRWRQRRPERFEPGSNTWRLPK